MNKYLHSLLSMLDLMAAGEGSLCKGGTDCCSGVSCGDCPFNTPSDANELAKHIRNGYSANKDE